MGNANNSKDPEDPRLSIGSSVDALPSQKDVCTERKRLEIHEEEGKSFYDTQNESRLLAPNQNDKDSIEIECNEEMQAVKVGVKLQSHEHRESTGFAFGPVIKEYHDLPENMQSTSLFPKKSFELRNENIFDDMQSPDSCNMNDSLGVDDKWKEVKKCGEKTGMLSENMNYKTILSASYRHSDDQVDKCNTKGVEGSPRVDEKEESCKDLKTSEETYGPTIEPCDDFPDGIQNTTLNTMESSKLKTKNILNKWPETSEVVESSSVHNVQKEAKKNEEKGELLLNHRNNDLLTFHQSSDKCSQMDKDYIKAKDYEVTQSTAENEESFKDQKSVSNSSGPVLEPCDHFVEPFKSKGKNSLEDLSQKRYAVDEKCWIVEGDNLAANVAGDDTTGYEEKRQDISRETSAALQKLVHSCSESVDNLQQDHEYIMELVNKSCSSQSSLNEEGMKIITELERIVEKFTERRKEKENAIGELKSILSKLTDNVKILEQEIQILQSKNEMENDSTRQSEKMQIPESPVDFLCSMPLSIPVSTTILNEDPKQTEQAKNEHESPLSQGSGPLTPDTEKRTINERKSFDCRNEVNEDEETKQSLYVNTDQENPNRCVDEVIALEDKNVLKSDSLHEKSSTNSGNGVDKSITTNLLENSPNHETNSNSSNVPTHIPENNSKTLPETHYSDNHENNSDLTTDTPNIQGNSSSVQQEQPNSSSISDKPNIVFQQNSQREQIQRKVLPDDFWQQKAAELSERLMREGPSDNECGWNTVLCLDVSDSMWGEAIRTMIRLALRFISGVEEASQTEKVGVICFGEDTRILSRCCLNFNWLRQEISKLKPRGPSPLTAGLLFSRVLLGAGVTIPHANGVGFHPRIIILSDGMATPELVAGSEDFTPDSSELSVIKTDMARLTQHFRNNCNRVYYVPLGQANEGLIEPMVSMTHGRVVRPPDFDSLIHQFSDELLAVQIRPYLRDYRHADTSTVRAVAEASSASLRGKNMDQIAEYVRNPPPQRAGHRLEEDNNDNDDDDDDGHHQEGSNNMPPIGTRVRRGPDWEPMFGSQDSNGPGTVVSQEGDGILSVMWDNGHRNRYPYGMMGRYAVMVVDEPRILQHDQFIEVGCLVKRGNDWRDNDNDGGPGSIGVVFRVYSDATVGVRWPTGLGRSYKYGKQGYFEVELCDPFDEDVRLRMLSMNFHASSNFGTTKPSNKEQIRIEDLVNSDDRNNSILNEMNRKNVSLSNQTHKHLTVDSGHPRHDKEEKETTKNSQRTNVDSDDPKLIRPVHNPVDTTRHVDSNKYAEATPKASNHADNSGYTLRNNTDVKTRELPNQVPNNIERSEPSVDNANGRVVAGDVVQNFVVEGGLEKSTQIQSSSLVVSINSDMSCDSEESSIDKTSRQVSHSDNLVQGNEARESPTDHSTALKHHDAAVQSVVWQVQDRYEGWKDFPNDISEKLEKVFLKNPQGMTSYKKDEKRFQVQLSTMIQVHPKTKEMSPIRRKINAES